MKITEVKFTKRVNNAAYEHEEMTLTASPEKGEEVEEIIESMRATMEACMSPSVNSGNEKSEEEEEEEESSTRSLKSQVEKAAKKKNRKEDEDGEEESDEEENEEDDEEEVSKKSSKKKGKSSTARSKNGREDSSSEEEEESSSKKKAPPKKKSSKAATYDRANKVHKKLIGEILDEEFPDWEDKLEATAKKASVKMSGKDFLDRDGEVLESFRSGLIKAMKSKS